MKSGVSTNTKASKFQYEPLQNKTKQLHCNKTNIIFTKKKCAELHIKADSHKQQELYCSYNFFFNVGQQPIDKTSYTMLRYCTRGGNDAVCLRHNFLSSNGYYFWRYFSDFDVLCGIKMYWKAVGSLALRRGFVIRCTIYWQLNIMMNGHYN